MKMIIPFLVLFVLTGCNRGPMKAKELKSFLESHTLAGTSLHCQELTKKADPKSSSNTMTFKSDKAVLAMSEPDCNIKISMKYAVKDGGILEMGNAQALEWNCKKRPQNLGTYSYITKVEHDGNLVRWTQLSGDQSCRVLKVL